MGTKMLFLNEWGTILRKNIQWYISVRHKHLRHHHTKANKPSKMFLNMFTTPNTSGWTQTETKHEIKDKTHKPTQVSLVFLSAGDAVKRTVSFFYPVFSSSDVGVIVVLLGVVFLSPCLHLSSPICHFPPSPSSVDPKGLNLHHHLISSRFISVYTHVLSSASLCSFFLK